MAASGSDVGFSGEEAECEAQLIYPEVKAPQYIPGSVIFREPMNKSALHRLRDIQDGNPVAQLLRDRFFRGFCGMDFNDPYIYEKRAFDKQNSTIAFEIWEHLIKTKQIRDDARWINSDVFENGISAFFRNAKNDPSRYCLGMKKEHLQRLFWLCTANDDDALFQITLMHAISLLRFPETEINSRTRMRKAAVEIDFIFNAMKPHSSLYFGEISDTEIEHELEKNKKDFGFFLREARPFNGLMGLNLALTVRKPIKVKDRWEQHFNLLVVQKATGEGGLSLKFRDFDGKLHSNLDDIIKLVTNICHSPRSMSDAEFQDRLQHDVWTCNDCCFLNPLKNKSCANGRGSRLASGCGSTRPGNLLCHLPRVMPLQIPKGPNGWECPCEQIHEEGHQYCIKCSTPAPFVRLAMHQNESDAKESHERKRESATVNSDAAPSSTAVALFAIGAASPSSVVVAPTVVDTLAASESKRDSSSAIVLPSEVAEAIPADVEPSIAATPSAVDPSSSDRSYSQRR